MVIINKHRKEPLYMQIYAQIRDDILSGALKHGDVLQGSRGLAKTLDISRNTVDNAYSQLSAEGYIVPRRGIGHVVMKLPQIKTNIESGRIHNDREVMQDENKHDKPIRYDLTNSSYTSDLFPKRMWRRYTLEALDLVEEDAGISLYQNKQGEAYLRRNLLSYLKRIRGVHCDANQILITCGIQQSLDTVCKLVSAKSRVVLAEDPGYHKAAAVFMNHGMTIYPVPVDEHGIIVSELPETSNACAIYLTPSHQFPTGATLSIGRRYELLEWAHRNDIYIIEDDFDSELRYYSKPIPSLQSIDMGHRVIYLGTFSKTLSPSIRMGYMILPPQLLASYLSKFRDYNCTVPILNQYVIAQLIETGLYDRHIRRLNHVFRKRHETLIAEFSDIRDKVKISSNGSGQYFLLEFTAGTNYDILIQKALDYGVKVYPTMQFWQEKAACPPNTLFLGFSKIDLGDIPDCVNRLKRAWRELL